MFQNYLIVDCGYTSRLIEHYDEMEIKPLFIFDDLWGEGLTRFDTTDEDVELFFDHEDIDHIDTGTIVFGSNDNLKIVNIVKMLQVFHHCDFFYIDDYYGVDPEEDHPELRDIIDADLDNFVKDGDEYYHGTLYRVDITQTPNTKVMTLHFDSESG